MRIRALKLEDRDRYRDFLDGLDSADLYQRTMGRSSPPDDALIAKLLDPGARGEIALAAIAGDRIVGVARAARLDEASAEFALIVRSALKRRGIGERLLRELLERLRTRGVTRVVGHTFAHNHALLALARRAGFAVVPGEDGATRRVERALG